MPMDLHHVKDLAADQFVARWSKYDPAELKEKLSSSTRAVLLAFADGLLFQVNNALEQVQQFLSEDFEGTELDATGSVEASLQTLRIAALLAGEMLHECHSNTPEALMTAAIQLHDHALLELGDSRPDVQDAVAKLCVSWWQHEAPDREYLVAQALPYLLARAISSSKAGHVKACYVMRGALELLDFDDASIMDMKRVLLQAAICPAFVTRPEGRKFLASLLTVHPSMVQEMTSVIRNQIPAGRRAVLDAYGEVILRGWRDAVGPCLAEIETSLIQNLMLAAIHGSGQSLVGNIRRVLSELHRSKRLGGAGSVDSMLVRLYEPILFRALAATNAAVRRNAMHLLLDAFPLLDPEAETEEQDELLVRQFQCLSDGLIDSCPSVRVVAAQGTCTVLNLYWEIIPSATTAGYVSRLTSQLAFDAALPAVRVAVLEGLQLLVDNQHAQPVLKKALPSLAPLMWDSLPRVREAMADLLLCISTSRGLHFWEVVPLDVLLEQMGGGASHVDGSVAQKLHQLLVPSYFPNPEEGAARIAALLKEHPVAGQSFCRMLVAPFIHYLDNGKGAHQVQVPLESILQLAASLMKHLQDHPPVYDPRSPPRKQRNRKTAQETEATEAPAAATGRGSRGKRKKAPAASAPSTSAAAAAAGEGAAAAEVEDGAETEVDVLALGARDETEQSWQALLEGLAEICSGIGMALQHELCEEQEVQDMFKGASLQQLLAACPNSAAERCVWRIAECLPGLSAVKQLLVSRMQLLAAGELLPTGLDVTAAGASSCSGANTTAAVEAAAVLACLAASSTGPKLAAMLCQGVHQELSGYDNIRTEVRRTAAGAAAGEGPQDPEDTVCGACGQTQPEHNMLLCDGCDAAYHTTCLEPELMRIPEGDWFCPGCCKDIKACALSRSDAVQHLSLLMLSDSGRQLLRKDDLLDRALSHMHQEAVLRTTDIGQQVGGTTAVVTAVLNALKACVLFGRAAIHVNAWFSIKEEQPLGLAQSYASILQQLAETSIQMQRHLKPEQPIPSNLCPQLVAQVELMSLLLKDGLVALKALDGLVAHAEDASSAKQMIATAAGLSAACGNGLLAGLVAVSKATGQVGDSMKGVIVLNTQMLKELLAATASWSPTLLGKKHLSAWLLLWLEAVTTTPMAAAAAAVKAVVPSLVAVLLGEQRTRALSTRAGSTAAEAADANSVVIAVKDWLPKLIAAAAEAEEREVPGVQQQQQEENGDEAAQDAENQDPNVAASAGDPKGNTVTGSKPAKAKSVGQQGGAAAGLVLTPVLEAVLTAIARQQAQSDLAARCLQESLSKGQQEDWHSSLGALRLWCCFGQTAAELSAGEVELLKGVRHKAQEDNGTEALLLAEQVGKVLKQAVAAS